MTTHISRRLMCILAHPDDETLGVGSTLAKYAAEGVETYVLTATRGQRGWNGIPPHHPDPEGVGRIREQELRAAADILGVFEVCFLDYFDGDLDQAPAQEAIAQITAHVRRVRPQVVITFAPDGAYGHPDHIAISQFTTAALVAAADNSYTDAEGGNNAHRVNKLYYFTETLEETALFEEMVGGMNFEVDGHVRKFHGWQPWAVTTRIDGDDYWRDVLRATRCHKTQLPTLGTFEDIVETQHRTLIGVRHYYRAYSLVNGGRKLESDLFEGL